MPGLEQLFYVMLPLLLLLLVWGAAFYLRSSDSRSHRKKWRELASLSKLQYHPRNFARKLRQVQGIDVPNYGDIQQAISGQLDDTWFTVLESKVRRFRVGGSPIGERFQASFCTLVVPTLRLPEFRLRAVSGRGLTEALNALVETDVKLGERFSSVYSLQGNDLPEIRSLFGEATQQWFVDAQPLQMEVRHVGDIEPTTYQLQLQAANQTLTLSFVDDAASKINRKAGPLPAREIQQLITRGKEIRDRLLASQSQNEPS